MLFDCREDKYAREDLGVQLFNGYDVMICAGYGYPELFPRMVIGRESLSLFVILAALRGYYVITRDKRLKN